MAKRAAKAEEAGEAQAATIDAALHDMEPALHQLDGVLTLLTILGEAQDSVEPVALASLASAGRLAFDEVYEGWRTMARSIRQP